MTYPASTTPGVPPAAPEVVVVRLRTHPRALFWPTLLLFAVCAATGYYAGTLPEPWQNTLLLVGAAVAVLLGWLLPLLSWLTRRYTLTTRRIIFVHGIFVRVRQEVLYSRGVTVSVRRTWLQSLFRSGTVRISVGPDRRLDLTDVPDAALVQQALQELVEQAVGASGPDQSALGDEPTFWTGR